MSYREAYAKDRKKHKRNKREDQVYKDDNEVQNNSKAICHRNGQKCYHLYY